MSPTSTVHFRFQQATLAFTSPTLADVSCQLTSVTLTNSTPKGAKVYTFCAAGGNAGLFIEQVDPDYSLDVEFRADWAVGAGFADYLFVNDLVQVGFTLVLDPGATGRIRTYTGNLIAQAASDGGAARAPETMKVSLQIVGAPTLVVS